LNTDVMISIKVYHLDSLSPWHGVFSSFGWRRCFWVWMVTANLLNKQLHTADKGW